MNRNQFLAGTAALVAGSVMLLLDVFSATALASLLIAAGTALVARSYRDRPLWPYFALILLLSMTIRVHKLNQVN